MFLRLKLPGLFKPEGCVRGNTAAISFYTRPRNSVSWVTDNLRMIILQIRAHTLIRMFESLSETPLPPDTVKIGARDTFDSSREPSSG